jgi:hypothetical protein
MMKLFARMVGCVAMAIGAVLFSFAGIWFGEEGSALRLARGILFETRRAEALRHRVEITHPFWVTKVRIIDDLERGRLRLREAIDQLQRLIQEEIEALAKEDADPGLVVAWVPPPTDPKVIGQNILTGVRADVSTWPPDKAKRLLADLESEFRELFGGTSLSDSGTDTALTCLDVSWSREPPCAPRYAPARQPSVRNAAKVVLGTRDRSP